jgi:hypothetical protein
VADDEELRIDALREELKREVESAKNDIKRIGDGIDYRFQKIDSDIANVWRWVVGLVAVFGVIAAILALASDII